MRAVRRVELALAGLIAAGAGFAALAPGALSSYESTDPARHAVAPPELPRVSVAEFSNIQVSDASRAVAAAVVSREARAARFAAPAPQRSEPGSAAVRVTPRASAPSGPAWSGEALGVQLTYAPPTGPNEPNWWLIGGGGRETFAVAPGGLREFTVAPVSAETSVGDTHFGVAVEVNDHAYASVGYVREVRNFSLGTEDWEEEEHYIGVGFQARW
ncbi:MAG: hypothetical protein ACFE0P_12360 [Oceanicaulis sp.]